MRFIVLVSVAVVVAGVSWVGAQDVKPGAAPKPATTPNTTPTPTPPTSTLSLFPKGYASYVALGESLQGIARAHPGVVRISSLGHSGLGRDLWMASLGESVANAPKKPAIVIVANLEADHLVGSQVALGLIDRLAKGSGKDAAIDALLKGVTVHIVPRLNPDGAERFLSASPRADFRTNLTATDRDRDGASGEDGPNDIDGDGVVLKMRWKDREATLVADAKDPRILRKADRTKGEVAVYSEVVEGVDDDNDGTINEDPPGGVNLNRNWPHGWTDFDPEAGAGPVSEPEVRALIEFATKHPEIVAVWTFGLNDNLRTPASGLASGDAPLLAELSKREKELTEPAKAKTTTAPTATPAPAATPAARADAAPPPPRVPQGGPRGGVRKGQGPGPGPRGPGNPGAGATPAPAATPAQADPGSVTTVTVDGALSEWAYQQFGVLGLASRLWTSPTIPDPPSGAPAIPTDAEARWLFWNDQVMAKRAFVPFHKVKHPTFGDVEVGGWLPGVRINPPIEEVAAITDTRLAFLKELASRLPKLAIPDVKVTAKGKNIYEIRATVQNDGTLPTNLAQGVTTRTAGLVLVRLNAPGSKILSGKPLNRINSLPGAGGHEEFRWLVLVPEGTSKLTLEASHPKVGTAQRDVNLK